MTMNIVYPLAISAAGHRNETINWYRGIYCVIFANGVQLRKRYKNKLRYTAAVASSTSNFHNQIVGTGTEKAFTKSLNPLKCMYIFFYSFWSQRIYFYWLLFLRKIWTIFKKLIKIFCCSSLRFNPDLELFQDSLLILSLTLPSKKIECVSNNIEKK